MDTRSRKDDRWTRRRTGRPGRFAAPVRLLALLAALSLVSSCGDTSSTATHEGDEETAPDRVVHPERTFYDYQLIETTDGVKEWVLDSDIMNKYKGRQDVDLVRVEMDFYQDGEYYSTLVADSGTAHTRTHDVHVWGDVVITTDDGRRLRTTDLRYTRKDGLIRNDVYNVFDRGEDVVTGIGLEATPDLDYLVIKHQVAGVVGDESADEVGDEPGATR
ncbi:LPS export ABC transporter periplasmic protein LptC [bacterium]|nr:LPS export ABC transporter periplasmic protein LptC [bacterium]